MTRRLSCNGNAIVQELHPESTQRQPVPLAEFSQLFEHTRRQPAGGENDLLEQNGRAELLEIRGPAQHRIPMDLAPLLQSVIIEESNDLAVESGVAKQLADRNLASAPSTNYQDW